MAKADDDHLSEEYAMLMVMLLDLLKPVMRGEDVWPSLLDSLEENAKVFHADEYGENPYYKNIKFDDVTSGRFKLTHSFYHGYELFVYDAPARKGDTLTDIPRIGCFDKDFYFPAINEGNDAWMSVTPNEIITMNGPVSQASGRVLTLGLGMGYYAYMVSLKDDVSSVTIIEREDDVIELFEKYILPQFSHKEKINIIKADAVEYMKNLPDGEYDYCFADIWQGMDDIASYFLVKEACRRRFSKMKMSYWIEDVYINALLSSVYFDISLSFYKEAGIPLPNIGNLGEAAKRQYDYVHRLLDNEEIKKPEHIDYYMTPGTLLRMIEETDEIF